MPCLSDDCQDSFPLDKVCRTCLTVLNPVNDIFETTLGSGDPVYLVLNYVCGLKISAEDRIPPNICISCLWKIKDFFAFKKNALFADLLLQEIVDDVECKKTKYPSVVVEGIDRQLQTEDIVEAPIIKEEQSSAIPYNDLSEASNTECAVDDESIAPQPGELKDNISKSSVGDLPDQGCRHSGAENEGIPVTMIGNDRLGYTPAENEIGPKNSSEDGTLFICHHCGASKIRKKEMMEHIYSQHFEPWGHKQSSYEEEKEDISQASLESAIESEVDLSVTYLTNSQNKRICTKVRREKSVEKVNTCLSKIKSDHLKHTEEKGFKCNTCDFKTKWRSSLKVHLLKHTGEKPFKCPHCEYRCSQKVQLKPHLLTHTGEKPFKCPHCDFRCSWKFNLKSHLLTHTGEKPFKCPHCDYSSIHKHSLISHIYNHTGEKPFECPHCEYRCSQKFNLKSHLLTHTGEKPFKCPHCDFRFSQKSNLRSHLLTHTGEKPFKCAHCDYRCSHKVSLKSHLFTHTGEKPLKCPYCDFRFSRKHHLKEHIRIHTGEKPFKCPHCDYRCSVKSTLIMHIRIHTGEKPFKCPHCDYRCRRKPHLQLHLRTHTGEKPFKCPHCDYRCSQKVNLNSHLLTHTWDKPFKCPYCDYRCSWKRILKNHILKHNDLLKKCE